MQSCNKGILEFTNSPVVIEVHLIHQSKCDVKSKLGRCVYLESSWLSLACELDGPYRYITYINSIYGFIAGLLDPMTKSLDPGLAATYPSNCGSIDDALWIKRMLVPRVRPAASKSLSLY